jgi:hypothetical protein
MRWVAVAVWLGLGLGGCAVAPAKYAGWEPLSPAIPAVGSPQLAAQRLEQSRAIWNTWRTQTWSLVLSGDRPALPDARGYSYVRARQRAKDRVDFTLLVVRTDTGRDRVSLRALLSADPSQLVSLKTKPGAVSSRWLEREAQVGQHEDAFPPRSIDQLYDDCAGLIRAHPTVPARLYFHPNGILMQCGFARAECDDCGEVSVQSFSHFPLGDEFLPDAPAQWLCSAEWGLFPPGSDVPELGSLGLCYSSQGPPPKRQPSAESEVGTGLGDICMIDRAACPQLHDDGISHWARRPGSCPVYPERPPLPLEVGTPDPLGLLTFQLQLPMGSDCRSDF